nr:prostaglandin F2-alpha receptor isoform X1 [Paramormyrops kingsleyae]XP_023671591.1 prostaglandin F2-alpha receptor isoform X1 [Paramormyrops kingsleyae]
MLSNASALEDCAAPAPPNITCVRTDLSVMVSVVSMTVGMLSNTLALVILIKAYRRFRLKSKASFLLLASGLVVTNFLGHLINGCLALYVYSFCMDWKSIDPHNVLCSFFGASMVFFGLSPLLLGSGMAVERCLGVTRPIFHSVALTSRHTKQLLAALWFLAAVVAALPIMTRRPYRVQRSRSWCFFAEDGGHWLDLLLPLLFACVGLLALLVSVLCNTVTGLTLMRSRMLRQRQRRGPTAHHLEMICQLVAIMLVSCVCWGPILVSSRINSRASRLQSRPELTLSYSAERGRIDSRFWVILIPQGRSGVAGGSPCDPLRHIPSPNHLTGVSALKRRPTDSFHVIITFPDSRIHTIRSIARALRAVNEIARTFAWRNDQLEISRKAATPADDIIPMVLIPQALPSCNSCFFSRIASYSLLDISNNLMIK